MKKMQLIVMAAAMLLMAGTAMAAGSATLNVTASVLGTCSIAGTGTLDFGVLDPATAPAAAATSSGLTINCSNGTPYAVTSSLGGAGLGVLSDGTNSFNYTLTLPPNGTGTGVAVAYNVTGNIAAGVYSAMPANIYTGTVTLNITP